MASVVIYSEHAEKIVIHLIEKQPSKVKNKAAILKGHKRKKNV